MGGGPSGGAGQPRWYSSDQWVSGALSPGVGDESSGDIDRCSRQHISYLRQ